MTADTEDAAAEAVDTDERTLALIPSVVRAYQTVLSDPGRFSRFALGPLAGLVIGNVMVMLEQAAADPPSDTWRNGVFLLQLAFVSIFSLFWQQQVLTGSATGSLDRLGLSFRELRFFGYCVLMVLFVNAFTRGAGYLIVIGSFAVVITGSFFVVSPLLRKAIPTPSGAMLALFFIVCGALLYAVPHPPVTDFVERALEVVMPVPATRLFLTLPAVVMGEQGDLVARSWRRTRDNPIQIYLGLAMCIGPSEFARRALQQAADLVPSGGAGIRGAASAALSLTPLLGSILLLVGVAIASSFLCFAYQQLTGDDDVVPSDDAKTEGPSPA
jgi:hypothetical protein